MSSADFAGLCEAVRRLDFAQAITLRALPGKQYDIVDGNHRLRAARVAGLTELPALVYPESMTDAQLRALRLALNRWRGEPRQDVVAADLKFLHEEGWSREDLYAAAGWDRTDMDLLLGVEPGTDGAGADLPDLPDPDAGSSSGDAGATAERSEQSPLLEVSCSTAAGQRELKALLSRACKRAGARGKFKLEAGLRWALKEALGEN
jgi:ParB-like chromosome segregation protein Spo0J